MRAALGSTLTLAMLGAASDSEALQGRDWAAVEVTAQQSLEYARTDEPVPWVNPDTGAEGSFTAVATHEGPDGQVCREYSIDAIIDGREEVVYGTACRQPDGTWVEATEPYEEEEPPAPASAVYSGPSWWWFVPTIAISGGYCSKHFCVGGHFGSYYPTWYYPTWYYPSWRYTGWYFPFAFHFSYVDYGPYWNYGHSHCSGHHVHGHHWSSRQHFAHAPHHRRWHDRSYTRGDWDRDGNWDRSGNRDRDRDRSGDRDRDRSRDRD
ncbi:MAG TPA: RT0821/Lpp0805 family surface protein, partial [Myxococcota bacterium]|nr:RT0821/Lpp0805 family surface protein [Myxococcota bacterium]